MSNSKWEQPVAFFLLLLGIATRLMPHPSNFAPISAVALFGGTYLAKEYALILPLMAMLASDMLGGALGFFPAFHATQPVVYLSFALSGLLGLWLRKRSQPVNIAAAAVLASVQFFLLTNAAVWWEGLLYPKTAEGLLLAYAAGLPFFRNTLLGDLFYTGMLFGAYELVRRKLPLAKLPNTSRTV